jgi:hypothetical protein
MRPTRLKLGRFKIVEQAELQLAPVTLLIGGNNAGKSTVLQALTLMAQSVGQFQLQTAGPFLDLGSTPAGLLNRSSRVGDGWSLEVTWEDVQGGDDPVAPGGPVEVTFVCRSGIQASPFETEGRARFEAPPGRPVAVRAWESAVGPRLEVDAVRQLDRTRRLPEVSEAVGPQGLRSALPFGSLPSPMLAGVEHHFTADDMSDPTSLVSHAQSVSAPYLRDRIARALGSFRYVAPDRHFSRSAYELSAEVPGVPLHQDDLANALAYDREVRRAVDQRCREMFGFGISADFAQGRNVDLVAVSDGGETYSLNHMGSGFGQVVWTAVDLELQLRAARAGAGGEGVVPLVGIEEPELHLHPAAQPRMARMIASYARSGVQQMLTTQSEHLLIALLQLVTAGELAAGDLAVYHLDGGRAEHLQVDERGRRAGGLKGFFEANEDELLARLEALIRTEDQP